jgi:hypothetical protein
MRSRPRRKNERFIEFVVIEVFVFMKQTFPFPRLVNSATAGLKQGEKLSGEAPSPGFRSWFKKFCEIGCQLVKLKIIFISPGVDNKGDQIGSQAGPPPWNLDARGKFDRLKSRMQILVSENSGKNLISSSR